jgi:hypothetical protein
MSTLKVNTVQHNTSGFNNVVQFTDGAGTQNGTLCRAWVNFDGTGTVAIRADFNVSSITDNGTGDYTVNFSNALSDANYCLVATTGNDNTNNRFVSQVRSLAVGSVTIGTIDGANAVIDPAFVFCAIFR